MANQNYIIHNMPNMIPIAVVGVIEHENNIKPCSAFLTNHELDPESIAYFVVSLYSTYESRLNDDDQISSEQRFLKTFNEYFEKRSEISDKVNGDILFKEDIN